MLVVRDLIKRYGPVEAVRGVSFEIARGEIFGLLGPNGAGKTSVIECAIGLRQPDGGSIRICGMDSIGEPEKVKERIGVVLQSTALQDKITPREALLLFGSFYRKRADPGKLLERFSLGGKENASFDSLSAGQRQRLALALAFVNEPELVFLDEPTAGLDPQSRRGLHQAILQMRQEGRTVLLTTHYIEEAHLLCDRVAIIDGGRIVASGKPDELIARNEALSRVSVRTARPVEIARFLGLPGVAAAEPRGGGVRLKTAATGRTVIELVRMLESLNNELLDLQIEKPSLEDVFIELTGRSLQD